MKQQNPQDGKFSFLLINTRPVHLTGIRWYVCILNIIIIIIIALLLVNFTQQR